MSPSEISIWFEIISFFFVTIDLYGEKRLKNLDNKITEISQKFDRENHYTGGCLFDILYATLCLYLLYLPLGLIVFFTNKIENFFIQIFVYFACIGLLGLLGLVAFKWYFIATAEFVIFILTVLFRIVGFIVKMLLMLFEKFKLKGILLVLGAVLFLISKAIALYLPKN